MSPCPEALRKRAISPPVTIILEALRRPSRFPTLPPPTSLSLPLPLLSLPPTIYVQITLCHRKVPRPPAGPLMRTSAHPASTIGQASAREKTPTTQNITPPHQAVGSIRFTRRISRPEVFSSGSVRFPHRISLPGMKSFPSASVMTGGLAGPSTRCAHDRPALPDPVGHASPSQNAVWKGCP